MPTELDLGTLGTRGSTIFGEAPFDQAGWSVSIAGDVNGDGYDDFIIGVSSNDRGGENAGAAYVLFGCAGGIGSIDLSNLAPSQGFVIVGDAAGDAAGRVSGAGDVNGDGFDDLIVGAPGNDAAGQDAGRAYVIFGKAGGFGTIDLGAMVAGTGIVIEGDGPRDTAGNDVAGLGDINGDGFDDFAVGMTRTSLGQGFFYYTLFSAPSAYVVFGGANPTSVDLTVFSSPFGFRVVGQAARGLHTLSFSSAGDFNGDGFDDIVVGDESRNDGVGEAYIVFGHSGAFVDVNLAQPTPNVNLIIQGDDALDFAGGSVNGLGDINADGYDDIIIGAANADLGIRDAGAVYIIYGRASGFTPIDLTNLSPSNGFTVYGATINDDVGISVSAAGDVNGDGFADILIGARGAGDGRPGAAYLLFGRAGGFPTIDLGHLDGRAGLMLVGGSPDDGAGQSVSGGGDINKDGFDDLIVGVPGAEGSQNLSGAVYVIYGRAGFVANTPALFDGDFNGDGRDDILWRNDSGRVTNWLGQMNGGFAGNFANADANAGVDWQTVGVGDFNGDNRDDILWRNANGDMFNWLGQQGGGFSSNADNSYVRLDNSWHVIGIGDFNGDNRDDILWRNNSGRVTNWLGQLNGSFVNNFANADATAGLDWHIVGTGDFNGDNRDDILWRNDDGDMFNWLGQPGGGFAINASSIADVDPRWHVAGIGDFNGDNRDDILWRDDSGRVTNWLGQLNGGYSGNFANADANAGLNWYVVGTGDYNGDNRSDVLWRNSEGEVTTWLGQLNGSFTNNAASSSAFVDNSWHVQSPDEAWI